MTRLLTGKDLRHIEIGTHLISVNAYDVGEVDDLIDAAADSIDTIYKENVRLAKKCAALEATISVLEDDQRSESRPELHQIRKPQQSSQGEPECVRRKPNTIGWIIRLTFPYFAHTSRESQCRD